MRAPEDVIEFGKGAAGLTTPGRALVELQNGGTVAEVKKKRPRGTKGGKPHVTSIKPHVVKVTLVLWRNLAHGIDFIAEYREVLLPMLQRALDDQTALEVTHPKLADAQITTVTVIKIGDLRDQNDGYHHVELELHESRERKPAGGPAKHGAAAKPSSTAVAAQKVVAAIEAEVTAIADQTAAAAESLADEASKMLGGLF